jgi:hypothetical protein
VHGKKDGKSFDGMLAPREEDLAPQVIARVQPTYAMSSRAHDKAAYANHCRRFTICKGAIT